MVRTKPETPEKEDQWDVKYRGESSERTIQATSKYLRGIQEVVIRGFESGYNEGLYRYRFAMYTTSAGTSSDITTSLNGIKNFLPWDLYKIHNQTFLHVFGTGRRPAINRVGGLSLPGCSVSEKGGGGVDGILGEKARYCCE
jgi:hypothetical protein